MGDALAWIGQLAEWVGRFFPRWIILNTTECAVKFVRGSRPVLLGPGIHWFWPVITEVKAWTSARQSINLPTITVTTKDGKSVAIGGIVIFSIEDAFELLAHTFNADQTIRDIASAAVHRICSQAEWSELQMAHTDGNLERAIRKELRRKLSRFGVRILDAALTDFAPCRVIKLIQATSTDS